MTEPLPDAALPLEVGETDAAVTAILAGEVESVETARFLTVLHERGETAAEIEGCVRAMLRRVVPVDVPEGVVELGGTGGDGAATFNISTTASLVVAACGLPVVKHGNFGVTSCSGSLDLLVELGVDLPWEADAAAVRETLARTGFAVVPTRVFHRLPPELGAVRRSLPFPTLFNLAGPLAHPARPVRAHVVGVADRTRVEQVAGVLARLGRTRATVLNGGGLDEPSLSGETTLVALRDGRIDRMTLAPEELGFERASHGSLRVTTPRESAAICRAVLDGAAGPARDIVLFTAAIALWTAGSPTIAAGLDEARGALDTGAAAALLHRLTDSRTEAFRVR